MYFMTCNATVYVGDDEQPTDSLSAVEIDVVIRRWKAAAARISDIRIVKLT